MASITLPTLGAVAATAGTATAAGTAAGVGAAAAGISTLGTIASVATAATGLASLGLTLDGAFKSPGLRPVLAMPDPTDPAVMNQQRLQYAMTQGKSGRSSTDLSSSGGSSGGNYSNTTAGSG